MILFLLSYCPTLRYSFAAQLLFIPYFLFSQYVGVGTTTPLSTFHVHGGSVLFTGDTGSISISGAGTRFMWIPGKRALRAGEVTSITWDHSFVGNYSTSFGFDAYASGVAANAFGYRTVAQASYSLVAGYYNLIEGNSTAWVATDPLFVLGNGYFTMQPPAIVRRNAFSVAKNGNTFVGGDLSVNGTNSIGSNLSVSGNHSVQGNLSVLGNVTATSGVTTVDDLVANSRFQANKSVVIKEHLLSASADNMMITVTDTSFIRIHSTEVASNRRIRLTAGSGVIVGQLLIIQVIGSDTRGVRIVEVSTDVLSRVRMPVANRDMYEGDTIMFIWDGFFWTQISHTDN